MRRLWMLMAAACLFATMAWGQVTKPIPYDEREMHVDELSSLEKENAHAIQLNNSTFFNATYADEFQGVSSLGEPLNKLRLIHNVQNSGVQYALVAESDIQVKMFLDAASVTSLRTERGTFKGKSFDRQFRVLRVYVYTPRGWKVVSQLETQLPSRPS